MKCLIDCIGWVGTVGFIIGCNQLAKKKLNGFYFNIFANISYIIIGYYTEMYSVIGVSICLILFNIKGVIRWKKKLKKTK